MPNAASSDRPLVHIPIVHSNEEFSSFVPRFEIAFDGGVAQIVNGSEDIGEQVGIRAARNRGTK